MDATEIMKILDSKFDKLGDKLTTDLTKNKSGNVSERISALEKTPIESTGALRLAKESKILVSGLTEQVEFFKNYII